jgi:hypothetical protein
MAQIVVRATTKEDNHFLMVTTFANVSMKPSQGQYDIYCNSLFLILQSIYIRASIVSVGKLKLT